MSNCLYKLSKIQSNKRVDELKKRLLKLFCWLEQVRHYLILQCLNRAVIGSTWMQRGTPHLPWVGPVLLSMPHSHWSLRLLPNRPKQKYMVYISFMCQHHSVKDVQCICHMPSSDIMFPHWVLIWQGRHPPQLVTHCQGRSFRRHSGAARCRERWGRCRTLPGCRCHGEHPSNSMK